LGDKNLSLSSVMAIEKSGEFRESPFA